MLSSEKPFQTSRTQNFRTQELCAEDERTIGHIERFGCSVISVMGTSWDPGWSYTIGVFDTSGKPDLITVGLPPETARHALNSAAELLRSGVDLTKGRHRDLIGNVECEFRPTDPKWVKHLMNWAVWYYEGANFPVLQAVYPDLENRFPEDEGFDKAFEQPLMQPGAPMGQSERGFWASADPERSLFNWRFSEPPHTAVFLSQTVFDGAEPVVYVSRDAEACDWQFLGDSMSGGGGPVISCFHHIIDKDPSLTELADLLPGWCAERRQPGEPWTRRVRPPDPD